MGEGLVMVKKWINLPGIRTFTRLNFGRGLVNSVAQENPGDINDGFRAIGESLRRLATPSDERFTSFTMPAIGAEIAGGFVDWFKINPTWETKRKGKKFRLKIV